MPNISLFIIQFKLYEEKNNENRGTDTLYTFVL